MLCAEDWILQLPALGLPASADKFGVQAWLLHQLFVLALLHDTAMVHDQDLVCVLHGLEAVRDQDDRLVPGQGLNGLLQTVFTLPLSTSQKRAIRLHRVVLPEPDGPTSAVILPAGMVRLTSCKISLSAW